MSRLAQSRTTAHEALQLTSLEDERCHRTRPDAIATPCGWVDVVAIEGAPAVSRLNLRAELVVVADGTIGAQIEELDEIVDDAVIALNTAGWACTAEPTVVDGLDTKHQAVRITARTISTPRSE